MTEEYITWSVKLNYTVHVNCGLQYLDLKTEEFVYSKENVLKGALTVRKEKNIYFGGAKIGQRFLH
jgi:hypothetical protein